MDVETTPRIRSDAARWLPLAGVGFAVLQVAGNLTIDAFPGTETSPAKLASYYAAHHSQVNAGGRLLEASAIFLALLGVALWVGLRSSAPVLAAAALVGATMSAVASATSGATYSYLADIGVEKAVTPEALQAWHLAGAGFGVGAGTTLLLLAVAAAGITGHAVPRWLGWASLVLAAATVSPFGFIASLVFILWAAAAGIALMRRPAQREVRRANDPVETHSLR